ncbi:hypothetical protein L2E82_48135 [Cichorium intybus]|uniref:Uncharacterized protein n=1 Tax=Cichorium intybus TaxID=13427 RepID=A0ACB8Z1M1_CICIN|nr:hypothetical protein L2E82_48135 [Cichorium intybus]
MIFRGLLIIVILTILPLRSYALSPLYSFRNLYEQRNVSPSPSPSHGVHLASGGSNFQQSCNRPSRSCQLKDIATCLTYSQNAIDEVWMLRCYLLKPHILAQFQKIPAKNVSKSGLKLLIRGNAGVFIHD